MIERYVNPFLVKDLESRLHTDNLYDWIDKEAEGLAALGFSRDGYVDFTIELCRARKISNIISVSGNSTVEDACIRAENNQYVIYYKNLLPVYRRRFAIAHEIGHTYWFFPDAGEQPLSPIQYHIGNDLNIEYLCDRFAAALLLPRGHVRIFLMNQSSSLKSNIPPLHLIPDLSFKFRVADQAVARRLFFQLFPRKLVIVCIRNISASSLLSHSKQGNNCSYELVWCALPAEFQQQELIPNFKIPLKTHGRVIPIDMVPQIDGTQKTVKTNLDERWWIALQAQPKIKARIPLKYLTPKGEKEAFITKYRDLFYIALPF